MGFTVLFPHIRTAYIDYIQPLFKNLHLFSQVPIAHACNPSYSGGRDQEDRNLKPALAKEKRNINYDIWLISDAS
jgi:hypothetical protein